VDCRPMHEDHVIPSCASQLYPECYSWILANVRRMKPVPMRGSLGLFEVDIDQIDFSVDDRDEIDRRVGKFNNLSFDFVEE